MIFKPSESTIRTYQQTILDFWDAHGLKDLPWRRTQDPWKTLLVEVLLRKTTSDQVREIYTSISNLSPRDVVDMSVDDLAERLKPLGLSRVRATQLKAIAEAISSASPEVFQSDTYLRSFPGIGHYIANSVRCNAFGEPLPALDTNMIRVIQRVFGWKSTRKRPREDRLLWGFAETLIPKQRPMEYNWGVLDLGAMICTHRNPKCLECPLNSICLYYIEQVENTRSSSVLEEIDSE